MATPEDSVQRLREDVQLVIDDIVFALVRHVDLDSHDLEMLQDSVGQLYNGE